MRPDSVDAQPWPADAVEVGRIVGAWGVRGALRVAPHAADAKALFATTRWFLKPPEAALAPPPAAHGAAPLPSMLKVGNARRHGDAVVAQAVGIDDRDAAERLRGQRVFVSRASFPTPSEGEYYWVDLLGLRVVDRGGNDLGEVIDLIDTGPHSVLCLRRPGAPADVAVAKLAPRHQRLIPFVGAYVDAVDLDARRITVDWPFADDDA